MAIRTSPIAMPPSSHAFSQSTPALDWDDDRNRHRASSSSPNVLLATPSDNMVSNHGYHRNMNMSTKNNGRDVVQQQQAGYRRSVRVRQASSSGTRPSSPQPFDEDAPSSSTEYTAQSKQPKLPVRPKTTRVKSSNNLHHTGLNDAPSTRSRAPQTVSNAADGSPYSHHESLAMAQAHGITVDQFEQAKQQVMRFLRTDVDGQVLVSSSPSVPPADKGKMKQQQLGRSSSYHAPTSVNDAPSGPGTGARTSPTFTPAQPSRSRPLTSTYSGDLHDMPDPAELMSRRAEQREQEKEAHLRRWAQEESSSSDEESSHHNNSNYKSRSSITASASKSSLLPSPFATAPARSTPSGPGPSPSELMSSVSKRGIMERFMSDRPSFDDNDASVDSAPQTATRESKRNNTRRRVASRERSPVRQSHAYPPESLMSPAPSRRALGSSVLFSPDVARLLRSELDQLEANENKSPRQRGSKTQAQADDIPVDDAASPLTELESSYGSATAQRIHDVMTTADVAHTSTDKQQRWAPLTTQFSATDEAAPSPSPSVASVNMRAPSFCDSSPSASDHAEMSGAPTHRNGTTSQHPASAPEFVFAGLPSSSPTSSVHSSTLSEYAPPGSMPRHRSSPGPVSRTIQRSASTTEAVVDTINSRKGRNPPGLKRADTAPALTSADGHVKPQWSYAALIGQAIFSTVDHKMSLADVYGYIMAAYPYYRKEDQGWQNSIRHNLSLNECFVKTVRGPHNPGKGCLWAIATGCEDQFANGGFVKRGGQGQSRKPRVKASGRATAAASTVAAEGMYIEAEQIAAPKSASLSRTSSKRSRDNSPAVVRTASPAPSAASSTASHRPPTRDSQGSFRAPSPSPSASTTATSKIRSKRGSHDRQTPIETSVVTSESVLRHAAVPSPATMQIHSPASVDLDVGLLSPVQTESINADDERQQSSHQQEQMAPAPKRLKLEAAYEPAPRMIRRISSSRLRAREQQRLEQEQAVLQQEQEQQRQERRPPSSVTASPPTSVLYRINAPYQPITYQQAAHNHRALALLASPEASGILPMEPGEFPRVLQQRASEERNGRRHSASSSIDSTSGLSHFLPAPHIFPGSAGRRAGHRRTDSDEKEERGPQCMLSPTALVHTQSPISSVRGGPRAPMSPVQAKDDKFASSTSAMADPEKKQTRAAGLRHIPAVAALADEAQFPNDACRSPPPAAARGHMRSPSARSSIGNSSAAAALFHQNIMSTPGARSNGRLWGMSPGVGDGAWSSWGDSLEAELERFGDSHRQSHLQSGGSVVGGPRLYWPSPGVTNHGAW